MVDIQLIPPINPSVFMVLFFIYYGQKKIEYFIFGIKIPAHFSNYKFGKIFVSTRPGMPAILHFNQYYIYCTATILIFGCYAIIVWVIVWHGSYLIFGRA